MSRILYKSFYVDNQFQETFIQYSRQTQNLYDLAYMLGYKPKATNAATAILEVYQQLPATISASVTVPDYTYAMQIPANTTVTSNLNGSLQFLITDKVTVYFLRIDANKPHKAITLKLDNRFGC